MSLDPSHDDVVRAVADWFEGNGFCVLTSYPIPVHSGTRKATEFGPSRDE